MSAIVVDLQDHRLRALSPSPTRSRKPSCAEPDFTSGQRQAYYGILDGIRRKNVSGALLQGYAGCGKTYLAARIIRKLQEDGYRVAVTAPTHKAVQVLTRELAGSEIPEIMTVHALLGLRLVRFLNGTQSFQPSSNSKLHEFDVIVVDECSMIDSRFFHLLQEGAAFLLFLGDPAQLPPVGNNQSSPVFGSRHLLRFTLDEVVRQKNGSPIVKLAHGIRSHDAPFPIWELHRHADGESLQVFTKSTFRHDWEGFNTRILAWRNQSVNQYNEILHGALFPADRIPYTAGERIVLQESTQASRNDQLLLLPNGGEGILQSVQDAIHPDWPHIPAWKMSVIMESAIVYDVQEEPCFHAGDDSGQHRRVIQQVPVNLWVPKDAQSVNSQSDDYFRRYRLESTNKNEAKAREYSRLGWKLRDDFTEIKQAYSSTVHKSQGSTYDTAIVDITDLAHPKARPIFNRLLYTAVTRPAHKLLLIV
jgi:exodeoxyribonuclease-5